MTDPSDITRDEEDRAFDKVRSKIERARAPHLTDDTMLLMKLTKRDCRAIMQFYRRNG